MISLKEKRGAEFTVTTLIVIVLAIVVLVVLALGFGTGWSNLWSRISGYFSPVNVDTTIQACQYACTTQSSYAYCCQIRDVKFVKDGKAEQLTCQDARLKGDCSLDCTNVQCEGEKKCVEQDGDTDKAKVCDADKCAEGKIISGTFSDVTGEKVCCGVACST